MSDVTFETSDVSDVTFETSDMSDVTFETSDVSKLSKGMKGQLTCRRKGNLVERRLGGAAGLGRGHHSPPGLVQPPSAGFGQQQAA